MERLDQLLVRRSLCGSRKEAKRAVMAGLVRVNGEVVDKAGTQLSDDARLEVLADPEPYVSRAGRKLEAALDRFALDPDDRVCVDIGASTGGFTDCLLKRGARRVYAVDVGYGQLDYQLRQDDRVEVMERVNARHLSAEAWPEPCSLATFDVSFISLVKVVPAVLALLSAEADLVTLIKPQFEAGREFVGKGGIVRDETARRKAIDDTVATLVKLGLRCEDHFDSPVHGTKGNREALAHFRRSST